MFVSSRLSGVHILQSDYCQSRYSTAAPRRRLGNCWSSANSVALSLFSSELMLAFGCFASFIETELTSAVDDRCMGLFSSLLPCGQGERVAAHRR